MRSTKKELTRPTAEDYALAQKVAEWMKLQDTEGANDYMKNLAAYARAGVVTLQGQGIVASAVASYQREEERRIERELEATETKSIHIGGLKQRVVLKVRFKSRFTLDGQFGTTYVHKFVVVEGEHRGAQLTWFGTGPLGYHEVDERGFESWVPAERGQTLWIKATIKGYGEYKGVKETNLTRVTLTEEPKVAAAKKKAERKSEKKAQEFTIDGESVIAYNVTQADGKAIGWVIRLKGPGKRKGNILCRENTGAVFELAELDRNSAEGYLQSVQERAQEKIDARRRKDFGEPVIRVRFRHSVHKKTGNAYDYSALGSPELSDYVVKQLSTREFGAYKLKGRHEYRYLSSERTLEEAVTALAEKLAEQAYTFEKIEV